MLFDRLDIAVRMMGLRASLLTIDSKGVEMRGKILLLYLSCAEIVVLLVFSHVCGFLLPTHRCLELLNIDVKSLSRLKFHSVERRVISTCIDLTICIPGTIS